MPPTHTFPRVTFLALDAYARIGGLQRFNSRVINNLAEIASSRDASRPQVHLLHDPAVAAPQDIYAEVSGFDGSRIRFARHAIAAGVRSDVVLLGHINLLPIGAAIKLIRPHTRLAMFAHGDEVWNGVARPLRSYEPSLLRLVDKIASVSSYTASIMAREFGVPKRKFFPFPNAVDQFDKTEKRASTDDDLVLAVTRLGIGDRRKNVDKLVEAFAYLKENNLPGRLQIVGDGALRPELQTLARQRGVDDRVNFLGRVGDEELAEIYSRAKVFALPSSKEGFGIVYLEAWQHRLPVICGIEGAAHEIVADGVDGIVCDERDPKKLAESIYMLISDPIAANAMGKNGFAKVMTNYTNECSRNNLALLLERLW